MKEKFKILDVKNPNKEGCNHLVVTVKYEDDDYSTEEICYHLSDFTTVSPPEDETELFKFLHQECKKDNIKTKEVFITKLKNKQNF